MPPLPKKERRPAQEEGAFQGLYPGYAAVDTREAGMVDLPGGAAYFPAAVADEALTKTDGHNALGVFASEESKLVRRLPQERMARYAALEIWPKTPRSTVLSNCT